MSVNPLQNQPVSPQAAILPQGLAVLSMVAGILSLLGCSMFAAIPAIVCGHIGVRQADRGEASGRGMAMAGLVMGYISLAVTVIIVAIYVVFFILLATAGVAAVSMGDMVLGNSIIIVVENDPAIVEHIGDVESCSLDFGATAEAAESAEQAGDQAPIAFEIKGSKGAGTLLLMQEVGNQEAFSSGTLVLPNDERIPLKALGKPDDSVELDLDMDISDFIDEGDLSAGGAESIQH